jgi:gas vesicle protein
LNYERALFFTAGVVVGAGVVCFVRSKAGKKTAVAIASKGLELKDRVVSMTERVKEAVDDVMAEAKYVNEQKAQTN